MKSLAILAAVCFLCSCATIKGSGGRFQLWEDKAEGLEIDGHDYQTIISNLEDWMKAFGKMEQDNIRMRTLLQDLNKMAKEVEIK